jgi:hypothetical protein
VPPPPPGSPTDLKRLPISEEPLPTLWHKPQSVHKLSNVNGLPNQPYYKYRRDFFHYTQETWSCVWLDLSSCSSCQCISHEIQKRLAKETGTALEVDQRSSWAAPPFCCCNIHILTAWNTTFLPPETHNHVNLMHQTFTWTVQHCVRSTQDTLAGWFHRPSGPGFKISIRKLVTYFYLFLSSLRITFSRLKKLATVSVNKKMPIHLWSDKGKE